MAIQADGPNQVIRGLGGVVHKRKGKGGESKRRKMGLVSRKMMSSNLRLIRQRPKEGIKFHLETRGGGSGGGTKESGEYQRSNKLEEKVSSRVKESHHQP